jgi:hypothetical protein
MLPAPAEGEGDDATYEYVPVGYTCCLPFIPQIPYGKGLKIYDYRVRRNSGTMVKETGNPYLWNDNWSNRHRAVLSEAPRKED